MIERMKQALIVCLADDRTEALELLRETRLAFPVDGTYYPSARISAVEALLRLRSGDLTAAQQWAASAGLTARDDPGYLLEIDYLVLARTLTSAGRAQAALALLEKLEERARRGGRIARCIEIHLLQGNIASDIEHCEQAACWKAISLLPALLGLQGVLVVLLGLGENRLDLIDHLSATTAQELDPQALTPADR